MGTTMELLPAFKMARSTFASFVLYLQANDSLLECYRINIAFLLHYHHVHLIFPSFRCNRVCWLLPRIQLYLLFLL